MKVRCISLVGALGAVTTKAINLGAEDVDATHAEAAGLRELAGKKSSMPGDRHGRSHSHSVSMDDLPARTPSISSTKGEGKKSSEKGGTKALQPKKKHGKDERHNKVQKDNTGQKGKGSSKSKTKQSKKSKGKGKGKGGGGGNIVDDDQPGEETDDDMGGEEDGNNGGNSSEESNGTECQSPASEAIASGVSGVTTRNPKACCDFDGPVGVFITHAKSYEATSSQLEPFWDTMYHQIDETSRRLGVCFVFTAVEADFEGPATDVVRDLLVSASSFPRATAIMLTDTSEDATLMNEVRSISRTRGFPSVGVFNAGYDNIIVESLVSGMDRLPFVGFTNDAEFGIEAGRITRSILGDVAPRPLCFNGRPDLTFVGERCSAYYSALTTEAIQPATGIECSSQSTPQDILGFLVDNEANAVYSHIDCCRPVAQAVALAKELGQNILAAGCQDEDTSGDASIDFVTAQPAKLQAYNAATWVAFTIQQELSGRNGREEMFFPSTQSFVNTAVFTTITS